jgi:hypothetical protein
MPEQETALPVSPRLHEADPEIVAEVVIVVEPTPANFAATRYGLDDPVTLGEIE